MLTKENQIRITKITIAIILLLAALVLILDRFPEFQESRWLIALGIFASITSPIAVYELLALRARQPRDDCSESSKEGISTGQTMEIRGDQQGTVTQNDQRWQIVQGPQTNVGIAEGPLFSGPVTYHAATKPPLPMQKPTRVEHFVGREDELASLLNDLQPGRPVTICGPGGMGKTALAAQAIWQLSPGNEPPERFPDGILFHSFYHKPQASLALEHIARSYGEDPRPSPQQAAIRALAGRQALVVLDGTEECDDLAVVLSAASSCAVIITTRRSSDAPAEFCNLSPLPIDDAIQLLQAWADEMASDEDTARRICELLGRLPLGIYLAGRYMAHKRQMAGEYLAWLEKTPLAALDMGKRQHESVPLLMEHSLFQVSDRARSCLGVAGVLAQKSFGPDTIAAALELTLEDANQGLGELVDFGLLIRPDARYQITHSLAHTYARLKLAPENRILSSLAEHYNIFAREKIKLGLAGYALLDTERDHVLAVQSVCQTAELWEAVLTLTWAIESYLDLQGHWTERIAVLDAGLSASRATGILYDVVHFLNSLGLAYDGSSEPRRAIEFYERALKVASEVGDRLGEGKALNNFGLAYINLCKPRKAIEFFKQALAISIEIRDRRSEGNAIGNLGLAHAQLGEFRKAIEFYKAALEIDREIGYRRGEGIDLGNLGLAHKALGENKKAIEFHEQALEIDRELGYRRGESEDLEDLGLSYIDLGELQKAIEFIEQSLVISREIGNKKGEGDALNSLGLAYSGLAEYRKSIGYHKQQLVITREIGDRRGEGSALWNISLALDKLDNRAKAIECARAAIKILEEIEDPNAEKVKRKMQEWVCS